MRRVCLVVAVLLLAGCATTIHIEPRTEPRAETLFKSWLMAVNADDATVLERYEGPLPRQQALRTSSGGYEVLSTQASANALMCWHGSARMVRGCASSLCCRSMSRHS